MADASALATHDHEEEEIHLPAPSIWPLIVVIGIGHLPLSALLAIYDPMPMVPGTSIPLWYTSGAFGALVTLVASLGWCTSVIKEKAEIDIDWGRRVLEMAWKLFLLSEAAIFGSFFGAYFYMMYKLEGGAWPPAGTPHIHLVIPAVGTGILVLSSVTCEFAHKALISGSRSLSKNWIVITILLGLLFIGLQGYEWGLLMGKEGLYPDTNVFGTLFYLITGFHGSHVITGLLLLILVYARLEAGNFTSKRHFALNAASWYWHFVDVIWLFVFFAVYVGIQH